MHGAFNLFFDLFLRDSTAIENRVRPMNQRHCGNTLDSCGIAPLTVVRNRCSIPVPASGIGARVR